MRDKIMNKIMKVLPEVVYAIVGVVLNPPKVLNSKSLNLTSGLVLFGLSGVALAFLIYNVATGFAWETALICAAIIISGLVNNFGLKSSNSFRIVK